MRASRIFAGIFLAVTALAFASPVVVADTIPIPGLSVQSLPGTYSTAIAVRAPLDGSGRLFIIEKSPSSGSGRIRVFKNGALLATPFLTVAVSGSGTSENGLLGLAFHPNFGKVGLPHNDEFYIAYTRPSADPKLGTTPDQAIARYTVPSLTSDVANPTGTIVLRVPDLASNHNGGDIHFGPDGYLYYSMGDSGAQGNPHGFAECLWKKAADNNPATCGTSTATYFLLGKIMRIDVDTRGGAVTADMCGSSGISPAEYSIPPTNPFVATSNTCDEIFLYGFRNPYRFSFDRETGNMVIGDVGQSQYEEITVQTAGTGGSDHGWSRCEGRHYYDVSGTGTTCPATTGTVAPVIETAHSAGDCAIIGGYVFRGPSVALRGTYFYGDNCAGGKLRYATAGAPETDWSPGAIHDAGLAVGTPYGYGEDEYGNLYIAQNSSVMKIVPEFIMASGFE